VTQTIGIYNSEVQNVEQTLSLQPKNQRSEDEKALLPTQSHATLVKTPTYKYINNYTQSSNVNGLVIHSSLIETNTTTYYNHIRQKFYIEEVIKP